MPRPQKYRDVIRFLRSKGWVLLRQGKGAHELWGHPSGTPHLSVPRHREISAGIVKQITDVFPDAPQAWR
ncbi:type II toxin-antitoxin system HicA family toxin [Leucobacter albus]|uniref:Type II toxin-antitoxin system HicA family toxin n=1 Tax=Leucobacter albus TaxID=272210 RepID=A0ABW3TIM1_9MICO